MEVRRNPSIFELYACHGLKDSLREAFRYLLENLPINHNGSTFISRRADETVLLVDIIIELSYLRSHRATYAESLYNLIRLSQGNILDLRRVLPSLTCATVVPYIRRKLDRYFEELEAKQIRTADELKRLRLYSIFTRSCSFVSLLYMLQYSVGKTQYFSPLNSLIGVSVGGRLEEDDMAVGGAAARWSQVAADVLGTSLTLGSYLIQFLDYWTTHTNSSSLLNAHLPVPEPPQRLGLAYSDVESSNKCLICLQARRNECALSNTGYVFCYRCIHRYVTARRVCPMTGQPTTVDNIIKLYSAGINTKSASIESSISADPL